MRLFIRNLLWICAFAMIGAGFTACSNDDTVTKRNPVISAEGEATSWGSAEITVVTGDIAEYAWLVLPSNEPAPEESVIFMDGTVVKNPATVSTIKASGNMVALTNYTLYIAAKVLPTNGQMEKSFYGEVISVPFTTLDYTDDVTIIRTTRDGAEIAIKYPELSSDKVVKWGICNMALHTMQAQPDYAFLMLDDATYPAAIIHRDTVLNINNDNRWVRDANGEIAYDEMGEAGYYWDFIAPGEPLYLLMSEASWGESDWGWGEGYYSFPFDSWGYEEAAMDYMWGMTDVAPNQDDYWHEGAYHKRVAFRTAAPEIYDGKVNISATDLTTKGGAITFTPDVNNMPTLYTLAIMDDEQYKDIVKNYLGGDESLMQWFVTSYVAMYLVGTQTIGGEEAQAPLVIAMEDFFYADYIKPAATYHAFAVAMDGEEIYDEEWDEYYYEADPMKQSYTHLAFTLPDYTTQAPVIEVTGLAPTSAWYAEFNVKCTTFETNPVVEACYAANDPKAWDEEINYYESTYKDIISQNRGYMEFSEEELEAINSAEGLTMKFDMRENQTLRLGVMGWNEEGRPSDPDAEGAKAVADATSGVEQDAVRVESPYFESLAGEWTATATVRVNTYNEDTWEMEWVDGGQMTTNVTIGNLTAPESLTDEIYQIYEEAGLSKEATDDYFAQFKAQTEAYNQKVRGQNRILCTGWAFDKHSPMPEYSDMQTKTPWTLFCDVDYNAASVADLFYAFGPKWYIQVAEDGSLFIPVNMNRIPAASAWGTETHLVGANAAEALAYYMPLTESAMDDINQWPNIPVEVSADGNTITLKSYDFQGTTYYPNLCYYSSWSGMAFFNTAIVSEVVLTRNTTATTSEKGASVAAIQSRSQLQQNAVKAASANGATYTKKQNTVIKDKTPFKPQVKAKKLEMKQLTPAQRDANIKMLREKMQNRARK